MSTYQVTDERGNVVLATDDWVDALTAAESANWPRGAVRRVRGTHPSHDWGSPHEGQQPPDRRCTRCGGWDNGSYGSQAPCGYDWSRDSLVTALHRERVARGRQQS